jgi:hypothetical protein
VIETQNEFFFIIVCLKYGEIFNVGLH